ncbi:MAG: hypothetical protein QXO30_07770 [Candidatus Caldarchaeum sp.]
MLDVCRVKPYHEPVGRFAELEVKHAELNPVADIMMMTMASASLDRRK